jgi:hypothetical protein
VHQDSCMLQTMSAFCSLLSTRNSLTAMQSQNFMPHNVISWSKTLGNSKRVGLRLFTPLLHQRTAEVVRSPSPIWPLALMVNLEPHSIKSRLVFCTRAWAAGHISGNRSLNFVNPGSRNKRTGRKDGGVHGGYRANRSTKA